MAEERLPDVSAEDVEFQTALFIARGLTVKKEPQPDGRFTLIATKEQGHTSDPQSDDQPTRTDELTAALKAAVRKNEIGDASPYQLSFARKDKSGASFGFMQGDL